jgi:hypothetical protein
LNGPIGNVVVDEVHLYVKVLKSWLDVMVQAVCDCNCTLAVAVDQGRVDVVEAKRTEYLSTKENLLTHMGEGHVLYFS